MTNIIANFQPTNADRLILLDGGRVVAEGAAAGVLTPIGLVMPMSLGAILMSVSTIVVAFNAQLLRRLDLRPESVIANSNVSPRPGSDTATVTAGRH